MQYLHKEGSASLDATLRESKPSNRRFVARPVFRWKDAALEALAAAGANMDGT